MRSPRTRAAALALIALVLAGCHRPESAPAPTATDARPAGILLSNHASRRHHGSAAILRGRVLLHHLWAEDAASSWSDAEQAEVQGRIRDATAFLGRWAHARGIDLVFVEETAGRLRSDSDLPTDMFADPAWTERLVRSTGAADANRLVADLVRRHRADAAILVFHVNKAALSYNLTFYDGVDPLYAAERIVCFMRYPDRTPTCAASYAHEILHSFGAGELYFPFDRTDDRARRARQLWPDDIMGRVDRDITKVNIGPFTAYRIGWTDRLDEGLKAFED